MASSLERQTEGCPQWRVKEVYVIYLLRDRVREETALWPANGVPQTRKGRGLELGQPSVVSCFSRGGDEAGLSQAEKRPGHSTHFRPKRQGQLRGQGQGEDLQLFSEWGRLK